MTMAPRAPTAYGAAANRPHSRYSGMAASDAIAPANRTDAPYSAASARAARRSTSGGLPPEERGQERRLPEQEEGSDRQTEHAGDDGNTGIDGEVLRCPEIPEGRAQGDHRIRGEESDDERKEDQDAD